MKRERGIESTIWNSHEEDRDMGAKITTITLFESVWAAADGGERDRLELCRQRDGQLSVIASRAGASGSLDGAGWREVRRTDGLSSPAEVRRSLTDAAEALGLTLDWADIVPRVADADWLIGAVLAHELSQPLPALPPLEVLLTQRPRKVLRALGSVTLGAEWGYDMHEMSISFDRWLRIVAGNRDEIARSYRYEGERYKGEWRFDGRGELEVGYDDGGVGWTGSLEELDMLDGPILDGVDIALLAVRASTNGA
jgi:hypothetical protein